MAVTTTIQSNAPLVTSIVTDTDTDLTIRDVASAQSSLYFVEITNPSTTSPVYVKIFAAAPNTNISTATQHFIQLYCPANTTCYTYVPTGLVVANGIRYYASTEPGVAGTLTAPATDVTVKFGSTPT